VTRALGILALALLTVGAAAAAEQTPLQVGAPAPDTRLVDQQGQPVHLAELLKQRDWVVVAFYVKAFTGG
jgi:cytochrome oxidase Cu insertion factor (SCO1/SenC/PrrC family)